MAYKSKFTGSQIDNLLTNSVIASSGSNSNGSWIQFADGTMICHHRVNFNTTLDIQAFGGYVRYVGQWTYPKAFIGMPCVQTTVLNSGNSDGASCDLVTGYGSFTATYAPSFYIRSLVLGKNAAINVYVCFYAIGRWK